MTETFISVGGDLMPANLQPPQSDLQGAFRKSTDGKRIVIDMPAAREIAKDMLRQARSAAWPRIDAARNVATETEAGMDAVRARANALRAVTSDSRIAGAKTPDDLLLVVDEIKAEIAAL